VKVCVPWLKPCWISPNIKARIIVTNDRDRLALLSTRETNFGGPVIAAPLNNLTLVILCLFVAEGRVEVFIFLILCFCLSGKFNLIEFRLLLKIKTIYMYQNNFEHLNVSKRHFI
jgi:hypothetical protein